MMHDAVGRRDRPFGTRAVDEVKGLTGIDKPFLEDTKIPAREAQPFNLERKVLDLPPAGKFPAGLAWLRDLNDSRADRIHVPDADLCFRELCQREIFSERPSTELVRGEHGSPMGPVCRRVGAHRLVESSMVNEVCLPVSCQIAPAEPDGALRR